MWMTLLSYTRMGIATGFRRKAISEDLERLGMPFGRHLRGN